MRGDLPAAALKLSQELPSRTHYAQAPEPTKPLFTPKPKVAKVERINNGKGRGGNNRKPVVVNGVRYASATMAIVALGMGCHKLYRMLGDGRAKWEKS